jgi:putative transposase
MAHSYTNLLYHIVFATKGRQSWLDDSLRPAMFAHLGSIVKEIGGIALSVNGMSEHVHILAKLRPDRSLSLVLSDIKSRSSGWVHRSRPDLPHFAWQTGYGAFTVGSSQTPRVRRYIENQEENHRRHPFEMEFRTLLRRSGYSGDEEFFWE